MKVISKMIGWWKTRRNIRRINKIKILIDLTLYLRIRSQFDYPPARVVQWVDRAVKDGLDFFYLQGLNPKEKNTLDAAANAIYEWLCSDNESKENLALRTRVIHLARILTDSEDGAREIDHFYQSCFGKELKPLEVAELSEMYFDLQSENRSEKLSFIRKISRLIKFETKAIAQAIPVFSVLLLVGGYLHTSLVYHHFGIEANKFFSLGDYLASSLNQVIWAGYAFVGHSAGLVQHYRYSTSADEIAYKEFHGWSLFKYWYENASFVGMLVVFHMFGAHRAFWLLLPIAFLILSQKWAFSMANKYFQDPFSAYSKLALSFLFIAGVLASAKIETIDIEIEFRAKPFVIEAVDHTYTNEEHLFLGGNDRYIFLVKKDGGNQIIPRERVKNIAVFEWVPEKPFPWPQPLRRFFGDKTGEE
ncbi:MAG: hypothetical protein IBGAMO2_580008 [Arenicellales bacterium IbO2]|nr:hypothetical protein [Gammaproteobacteria bacterium]MDA8022996.1 hypothetical protein [Gammaproteobacteria bacterium]CAJ2377111.1 MAG: hypothetical protein IBGAMO2_580008 [Arenicellales bacterium IbO2]